MPGPVVGIGLLLLCIFIAWMGYTVGRDATRAEAELFGAGYWDTDEAGRKRWVWGRTLSK